MTTTDLISHYAKQGWTFKQVSWPTSWRSDSEPGGVGGGGHGVEIAYSYQSPRMRESALIRDGFGEDHLLIEESEYYTRQTHGAAILASFHAVVPGIVREIATLYRLRDRGKVLPLPESITLKDVVVKL